jgi:CxxC motif-containing protein
MREMICITCPQGCTLQVEDEGEHITVTGNACKRGVAFAIAERTNPTRSLCSTVRTVFSNLPMLPVRTDREIPKSLVPNVMRLLATVVVREPIPCGGVVVEEIPGCNAKIIATSQLTVD